MSAEMDVERSDGESSHKKARLNEDYSKWDAGTLNEELKEKGFDDVAKLFREKNIAGDTLKRIGGFIETLKIPGLPLEGQKVFMDPIHGLIELHPLCVKIIDTPEFQRLRFVKQIGTIYFVYPGASHNRFEHSLGVCHLAGRLVRAIKSRQPDLGITDKDVLCVEIAGLCHDLGHGPFSHLFDRDFIPKVRQNITWEHEQASIALLDHIIETKLKKEFKEHELTEDDITFIKEQIRPEMKDKENAGKYKGRPDKTFLYDIVANKRNGIDVDKWDYLARDCYMLGIQNNFDHNRCIQFARVLNVKGDLDVVEKQICTREKEAGHLYDMFYTRYMLYRRACKHKTVSSIEFMITEALIKANDCITFTGKDGRVFLFKINGYITFTVKKRKMSEAIDDMEAYSKMTDEVMFMILNMNDENLPTSKNPTDTKEMKKKLAESKEILTNVMSRKFTYKYTMHVVAEGDINEKEEEIENAVKEIIEKKNPENADAASIKVQIWALKGRTEDKSFLYEIVANKRNGIDVDKWDYFARDCLMLGIRNNFDYTRFIHFARVLEVNGAYQICTRDKDSETLYDMFHIRQTLHRIAYSHKTSNIIQKMVTDAFVKANDHIKFVGEKGVWKKMSEAIDDMKAFSQMTDHVFNLILNSTDPNLKESRDILTNVLKRKLYKCVGQTQAKGEHMKKEEDKQQMIKEMRKLMDNDEYEYSPLNSLSDHGIVFLFVDLDHGMNEKNPIENTMFYCKDRPNEAFHIRREQESNFLPVLFKEQAIRVYSKADDKRSQNMVREAFVRWCGQHKYPTPKGGHVNSSLTRVKAGNRNTQQPNEAEQQQYQHRRSTRNIKQEPDL